MSTDRIRIRTWARWVGSFVGFPLAGVAARMVAGDIDTLGAALTGGLVGGAVLGAVQAGIGGIHRDHWHRWIGATAVGFAAGLGAGAAAVGYHTDTASLVAMGAISGAFVGVAQAWSVPMEMRDRIRWALAIPALWAGGWAITAQVIVDADRQHAVFGSSGALAVSLLAGILHATQRGATHRVTGADTAAVVAVAR